MEILKDYLNPESVCGFVEIQPVRDFAMVEHYLEDLRLIGTNINRSIKQFIKELQAHEESVKRDYKGSETKDKYEAIYGTMFDCLLPKGDYSEGELKSIASRFYKYVVGKEKGLKYIAMKYRKGNGMYLKIYMTDREYYYHRKIERYTKNIYMHASNKSFCKKDDPYAVLRSKKGDPILDKQGNPKTIQLNFKTRKTRIFVFKKEQQKQYKQMMIDFFLQAVKKVKTKVEIVFGRYFRRMNLAKACNRFVKRIIVANNRTMQFIQNLLNQKIKSCYRFPTIHQQVHYAYDPGELIPDKRMKDYLDLFDKYQEIFRTGIYEHNCMKYKIKHERCDVVEDNLNLLKQLFQLDFTALERATQ